MDVICRERLGLADKRTRDLIARLVKAWDGLHNLEQLRINARAACDALTVAHSATYIRSPIRRRIYSVGCIYERRSDTIAGTPVLAKISDRLRFLDSRSDRIQKTSTLNGH